MTENNKSDHYTQIIVGSGAAGLTAAIYSSRSALEPVVFEGGMPGGQLTTTSEVENFPGFENGILGPRLMEEMKKQALSFGARFLQKEVERADFSGGSLELTAGGERYIADSVIVATGARPRFLGLEGEKQYLGRGVSTCATCDAFFYRGKKVVVVGGGDSAMEETSYISKFASSVLLVHRRDELRASRIMQDRVLNNPKIKIAWNTVVEEILGSVEKGVEAVRLKNVKTGETVTEPTDGFFLAIGHIPNTEVFKGQLWMDRQGYLLVGEGTATSVPGVFAAGDVVDHRYRQAVTAAGMGCMASLDAEKYLNEKG
ncbi:MAG: thioredoxin-disulfide reductase [Candidatus Glassbacteria bacterium]|nr:thioredoxin-disulfide reductase [Candidatus Glassbacteria bacterium]